MNPVRLLEQTPRQLARLAAERSMVLIPIGSVEWHADHLPLGVDSLLAQSICEEISAHTGCVIAPLITTGVCRDLQPERGYFGTIDTIPESILTGLVEGVLQGCAKMGFRQAVLFSGHFESEHFSAIKAGIARVPAIRGSFKTALDWLADLVEEHADPALTRLYAGDHAAEWETSLMLHCFPALVHMEHAPETIDLDMPGLPEYIRRRYPRRASREYGAKIHAAIIERGTACVQEMLATG